MEDCFKELELLVWNKKTDKKTESKQARQLQEEAQCPS